MAKPETALADAAAGFDEALAAYSRLGELFLNTPLASVKQLERANATLGEIAACEERLQAAGQRMVQALSAARSHQEQLAGEVVGHVPVVQARNQRLNELMNELTAVAGEVGGLNHVIAGQRDNGDATRPPTLEDVRDVSTTVFALADRAERLAIAAREAEFEELATQAHALHQRLQAIGKKLQKAGAGAAGTGGDAGG
jgi:predicted  nucleic acid-binding Zn-ribbon protein